MDAVFATAGGHVIAGPEAWMELYRHELSFFVYRFSKKLTPTRFQRVGVRILGKGVR